MKRRFLSALMAVVVTLTSVSTNGLQVFAAETVLQDEILDEETEPEAASESGDSTSGSESGDSAGSSESGDSAGGSESDGPVGGSQNKEEASSGEVFEILSQEIVMEDSISDTVRLAAESAETTDNGETAATEGAGTESQEDADIVMPDGSTASVITLENYGTMPDVQDDDTAWFVFTAPEAAEYYICAESETDVYTYAALYDSNLNFVKYCYGGGNGGHFGLTCSMNEGDTYYVYVNVTNAFVSQDCTIAVREKQYPTAITGIVNMPEKTPYGVGFSIYDIEAVFTYGDGSTRQVAMDQYDSWGNLLSCRLSNSEEVEFSISDLATGDYQLEAYSGDVVLSQGFSVVPMTDYVNGLNSVTMQEAVTFTDTEKRTLDYAVKATTDGVYKITVDGSGWVASLYDPAAENVSPVEYDFSGESPFFLSCGMNAGQTLFLRLERYDGGSEPLSGSIAMSQITAPTGMTVTVPEKSVYGDTYKGIQVTLTYGEELPSQTISMDSNNAFDSYGNKIKIVWGETDSAVGQQPITVSCSGLSQDVVLNVVSRLNSDMQFQTVSLPDTTSCAVVMQQYENGYVKITSSVDGDYRINLNDSDSDFRIVDADEIYQESSYTEEGQIYSLKANTPYLVICEYNSDEASKTAELTFEKMDAVSSIEVVSAPQYMTDWGDWTEQVELEVTCGETVYSLAGTSDTLSDGRRITYTIHKDGDDTVYYPYHLYDGILEYGSYTVKAACGEAFADIPVIYASYYDVLMKNAAEIVIGENTLEDQPWDESFCVCFEAESAGYYSFTITGGWGSRYVEDDSWPSLPESVYLNAGERILLNIYKNSDVSNLGETFDLTVTSAPEISSIVLENTDGPFYGNNCLDGIKVTYKYKDETIADESGYLWDTIGAYRYSNRVILTKDGVSTVREDGYSIDPGTYTLKVEAGGASATAEITVVDEWEILPELNLSEKDGEGNLIPTELNLEESVWTYYKFRPEHSGAYCFEVQGASCELLSEDGQYLGWLREGTNSFILDASLWYKVGFYKYNSIDQTSICISETTANALESAALLRSDFWEKIDEVCGEDIQVTYKTADGVTKTMTADIYDEYGFKAVYQVVTQEGYGVSELTAGETYICRVTYAGSSRDLTFTAKSLSEANFAALEANTAYEIPALSSKFFKFTTEKAQRYQLFGNCSATIYDAQTLEPVLNTEYNSNLFDAEAGKTYYLRLKNYNLNEAVEFTMESGKKVSSIEILQQHSTVIPEGVPYFPLASKQIKVTYESGESEAVYSSGNYIQDDYGNLMSAVVTDAEGNSYSYETGLKAGTYTVTLTLAEASVSYDLTVKVQEELPLGELSIGQKEFEGAGLYYFKLVPTAANYLSSFNSSARMRLYNVAAGKLLDQEYSGDRIQWTSLTVGAAYYVAVWFDIDSVKYLDKITWEFSELKTVSSFEIVNNETEFLFGEAGYLDELEVKTTYEDESSYTWKPEYDGWRDEQGYYVDFTITNEQGNEVSPHYVLPSGTYTVTAKHEMLPAVTYEFTIASSDAVTVLTEGSQEISLAPQNCQIYQIPKGDAQRMGIHIDGNVEFEIYTTEREEGNSSGVSWSAGHSSDHADIWLYNLSQNGNLYLKLTNLEEEQAADSDKIGITVVRVQQQTTDILEGTLPVSTEPLGWRYEYELLEDIQAEITYGSETVTKNLYSAQDEYGYYYLLRLENMDTGEQVNYSELQENQTCRVILYQCWGGQTEAELYAGEVTFVSSESAAAVMDQSSGAAACETEAGKWYLYSFMPEVTNSYVLSFAEPVEVRWITEEDGYSYFSSAEGKDFAFELTENEAFYFRFRTENGVSQSFTMLEADKKMYCSVEGTYTYTGSAVEPAVTVVNGYGSVIDSGYYAVTYSENINAGTATVTVTGTGSYAGLSSEAYFRILPQDLSGFTLQAEETAYVYNGSSQIPAFTVKTENGQELAAGTDYIFDVYDESKSSFDSVSAGTKILMVSGKENYTGSLQREYSISQKDIQTVNLSPQEIPAQAYQSGGCRPVLTLYDEALGRELSEGSEYTLSYENDTQPGTATVTVSGQGNYTGTISKDYVITSADLSGAVVAEIPQQAENGLEIEPAVSVSLDGVALNAGEDYDVSYEDNVDPGRAAAVITGKNGYTGSIRKEFTIVSGTIYAEKLPAEELTENSVQKPETGHGVVWYQWNPAQSGYYLYQERGTDSESVRLYKDAGDGSLVKVSDGQAMLDESGMSALGISAENEQYYIQLMDSAEEVLVWRPSNLEAGTTGEQIAVDGYTAWKFVPQETGSYQLTTESSGTVQIFTENLSCLTELTLEQSEADFIAAANFREGVSYLLLWKGGAENCSMSITKAADMIPELTDENNGVNTVYIPGGASVTFKLPAAGGRRYVSCEQSRMNFTVGTEENPQMYQQTGCYGIGYVGSETEILYVTVENLSELGVTELIIGTVPEVSVTAETSRVPQQVTEEWLDAIAGLIQVEVSYEQSSSVSLAENSDGSQESSGMADAGAKNSASVTEIYSADGQRDPYGYSWLVVRDAAAATENDSDVTYTILQKWLDETPETVGSFTVVSVEEENLTQLRRSWGSGYDALDVLSNQAELYSFTPVIDGSYMLTLSSGAWVSTDPQTEADYVWQEEIETTAGARCTVLIVPGEGSSDYQYRLSRNTESSGEMTLEFDTQEAPVFTGLPLVQAYHVEDKDSAYVLEEGVDYTASVNGNTNAGVVYIYLTGLGEYSSQTYGTVAGVFQIQQADISAVAFPDLPEYGYTGKAVSYAETVQLASGYTLVAGRDYEVTAGEENITDIGTKTVTLTGKNNFTGSKEVSFKIVPRDLSSASVTVEGTYTYTGSAVLPEVTVTLDGETLAEGTDYTATGSDTEAGAASVLISGIGNYTGSCSSDFEIAQKNVAELEISDIADQIYNRKAKEPDVIVKHEETVLHAGTDYQVTYKNNVNLGTGTAVIKGQGNYTGETEKAFAIVHGEIAYVNAVEADGTTKHTYNRFEQNFLSSLLLNVIYSDGSQQTVAAGGTDSFGRTFTAQIVDSDGNEYTDGSVLNPGTYTRQITVSYPQEEGLDPETYDCGSDFTVLTLAQSYEENAAKAGDTVSVSAADTDGEPQILRFTAERDWKYLFSSETELTLQPYDENGKAGDAITGTAVELELAAGTYFYELTAASEAAAAIFEKEAPAPVESISAYGDVKCINVSWSRASKIDTGYRLYRRAEDEAEFTLLESFADRDVTSYADYDVEEETIYSYKIVVTDGAYVVSADSAEASAQTLVDTEAPVVTSLTPGSGRRINGTVTITMSAQDNVAVDRSVLSVKNAEDTWEELASGEGESCSYALDTTAYEDGVIEIRAMAYDRLENASSGLTCQYEIDNSGPQKVQNVTEKEHTSVTVTLRWDDVADEDISFYRVEEKLADGTWQKVGDTSSTLGLNIKDLTPECSYTYRVIGYDTLGNRGEPSEEITVTTAVDTISPVNSGITPVSGYYQNEIPMTFSGSDEHGLASLDIQVKASDGEWTTLETFAYDGSQKRLTQDYTVNAAALPEGIIRVRGIFTDMAGNVSDMSNQSPFVELVIDRTAPAKPQLDQVIGRNGYVELIWTQGSEDDLSGYHVYRCDSADGTYAKLASGLTSLNYADTTAEAGKYWYYKITVSDLAGNESEFSDINGSQAEQIPGVEAAEDTQKPRIRGVYPTSGAMIGKGSCTVTAGISDNSGLEQFTAWYKINDGAYEVCYQTALTGMQASPMFQIPMASLADGDEVSVQIQVTDAAENASTAVTVKYQVDLLAPAAFKVKASYLSEDEAVEISWQGGGETDASGYRIYRAQEGSGSWKFIGQLAVNETDSYTYTDWNPELSAITYVYKVEAVDIMGNASDTLSDPVALPDRSKPTARIDCESVMEMQVEYRISAANSSDNTGIVSWEMDMGDGTVYRSSEVVHMYGSAGTYTITLTVTDEDGNIGQVRKQVTVKERTLLGTVKVLVQGTDGLPIAGAPVYFDLGETEQFIRNTDGNGYAEFTAETGSHAVGCVIGNNEYLPQKKDVVVSANAVSTLTFTMVQQPIIEGSFEIKRMTFEEIEAAGIDMDDPENQYIVKIKAKIRYGLKEYDFEFNYNFLKGLLDWNPIRIELDPSEGGDRWIIPNIIIPGPVPDPTPNPDPDPDPYPDIPAPENLGIGLLEVPIGVSALKEFFNVKLHILNHSGSEFSMLDNLVTLNLPGGLSIVDTEGTQGSAAVEIPEIQGGTQTTVNWILRGDEVGSYLLSADYSGILSDFNAPMTAKFEAEEPIEVYGLSGMKLTMHVAKELKDDTLYFDLDLENEGEIEVYMPSLSSDEDSVLVYQEYFKDGEQVLIPDTTVMKPGEKLVHHYRRAAEVQEDSCKYLKEYWAEVGSAYGLTIEFVEEELSYFRAADDKVTLTFNSMGGSKVASMEGLPTGKTFEQLQSSLLYSYLKWPVPVKDGLYFNGWYKTADCSGEPFDKQTVIDGSITLYAKWGKESSELGSLSAKVGRGQYGIHFVNSKGIPIEGVEVTLNDTTRITDKDGDAVFWKPLSDTAELVAKADGYCKHEDKEYKLEKNRHDMIILYTSQEKKFFMKKALYHLEDSDDTMNIMKEKLRLTILRDPDTGKILEDQNPPFAIDCYINADSGGDFYRMELWQKDNLLQTVEEMDENGCVSFTGLDLKLFEYTNDVFVKTYFRDTISEGMVKTDLNVDICDLKDFQVCFGDGDGFRIPSGVPLLGGASMEIKFPTWPTYYHIEQDGTIEAGINVTDTFMASEKQRKDLKKFLDDTKEAYSTAKGLITKDAALMEKLNGMANLSSDEVEFKVDGIGMARGQLTRESGLAKLSGNILIIIEVKWGFNVFHMIAGVVPVSFEVDFGGEAETTFGFGYSFKEDKWQLDADLVIKPFIELFAGLGVHDVLAAGGYGRGEGSIAFDAKTKLILDKIEATYSIGLKAYAGPFEFKYELVKPDEPFELYNRSKGASVSSIQYAAEYVSEEVTYNYVGREYLDSQSDWMGEHTSQEAGELTELLTDTYGAADPQMITAGDTTLMVYIGDTSESGRTAANMGQLMYSVYRDGIWQKPQPVDHNDYADVNFNLYADGETIYLVYQEADQIFADTINKTPVDYFNSLDIVTVVYDEQAGAFGEPQKLTDTDKRYDSMPDTVVHDGRQITVWVSNENGDLFTANSTNEIRMRAMKNGTASETKVLQTGVQRVLDLEAGILDGAFAAVYVEEGDTTVLNLLQEDGNPVKLAEGDISQPQFVTLPDKEAASLVWYQDGNLMVLESVSGSTQTLIDGNEITIKDTFRIVENYILYIGTDENGQSSVYASVYRDGSWKEPVVVTSQTDNIYQLNAAMVDGQPGLVIMQSTQTGTGDSAQEHYTLGYLTVSDTHNLVLVSGEYDDELAVPGELLPVAFTVKNKGTAEITSVEAQLADENGTVLSEQTYTAAVGSAEMESFAIDLQVPEVLDETQYTLSVWESGTQKKEVNEMTFSLYRTDLSLDAEINQAGKNYEIYASVENRGYIASGGTIRVYSEFHEELLYETVVEELAPGESDVYMLRLDTTKLTVAEDAVTIELDTEVEDYDSFNNNCIEMIYQRHEVRYLVNGSLWSSEYLEDGSVLVLPQEPQGATQFLGWYRVDTGEAAEENMLVSESIELEAKFADALYCMTVSDATVTMTDDWSKVSSALESEEDVTVSLLRSEASEATEAELSGTLTIREGNTLVIAEGVVLTITKSGHLTNHGNLNVYGELVNEGVLSNGEELLIQGKFLSSGTVTNTGTANNNGSTVNTGTVANTGTIYNSFSFDTEEGTVTGSGSFINSGTVTGEDNVEAAISSHVHVWLATYTIDQEAACYQEGIQSLHCSVDGCQARTGIASLGMTEHSYGEWTVRQAPTLTEEGSKVRICQVCNHTESEEIPNLTDVPYQMESLVVSGWKGAYDGQSHGATVSGAPEGASVSWFAKENGTALTEAPAYTQEGLYILWYRVEKEGYETAEGNVTIEITACRHIFSSEWVIDTPAGEETVGYKSYHCTVSGCTARNHVTVIPATGSKYSEMQTKVDEITESAAGNYKEILQDYVDTILEDGAGDAASVAEQVDMDTLAKLDALYVASVAEESVESMTVIAESAAVMTDAAGNTVDSASVEVEGAALTAAAIAKELNESGEEPQTVRAQLSVQTLSEEAIQDEELKSRLNDGSVVVFDINLSVVNAETGEVVTDTDTIQPKSPIRITITIPVELRHSENLILIHQKSDGTEEELSYTRDKENHTITFVATSLSWHILSADECREHQFSVLTGQKEPTCCMDGWKRYRCRFCTEAYTEVVPATGIHSGGTATCKEPAVCEVCGEFYGELGGHTGGEASCSKRAVCSVCGEEYGDLLAHEEGTAATCQSPAICKNCGNPYGESGSHSYSNDWTVDVQPTCTANGSKSRHCTVSGCTSSIDVTVMGNPGGHTGGKATCMAKAVCSRCGESYGGYAEHKGGKATCTAQAKCEVCGKAYGGYTEHQGGKATCQSPALCSTCGRVYGGLGSHIFSSVWTVDAEATCLKTGSKSHHCTVVGCTAKTNVTVIPKLDGTIKLTASKLNLQLKKSASLKSIVAGLMDGDYITGWSSSNKKYVTVNGSGKITGKKVGTATITVKLASGVSADIKVTVQKKAVPTSRISIASRKIRLEKGRSQQLAPVITPVTTQDKVSYKSSNKKTVTVTSRGKITAKASGKAVITIKSGKKSIRVTVTVPKVQPTRITGVPAEKSLKKGKTYTLKPRLYPKGAEAKITYSSSSKKVATVSSKGKITARKKGTAIITVKAGKAKIMCKITVK